MPAPRFRKDRRDYFLWVRAAPSLPFASSSAGTARCCFVHPLPLLLQLLVLVHALVLVDSCDLSSLFLRYPSVVRAHSQTDGSPAEQKRLPGHSVGRHHHMGHVRPSYQSQDDVITSK